MTLPLKDRLEVVDFIDERYPEMGVDNRRFAVYVVLLSAVILNTTDPWALQEFTGYAPRFVNAVLVNLRLNKLICRGRCKTSRWLKDDYIDDYRFWEEIKVASGTMYFEDAAVNRTTDVDYIEHIPKEGGPLSFLQ